MGKNVDQVEITCVGCQFNHGELLDEICEEYSLEEIVEFLDLVPDPTNKFNARALKWVIIERSDDGYNEYTLGYVPDTELEEVHELLEEYSEWLVPHSFGYVKRTARGEIQWIKFNCEFYS